LTIKFAHRKLDQHIVLLLTPSLLEYPKPSLDGSRYPEELSLSIGNLPIRLSKSTEKLSCNRCSQASKRILPKSAGFTAPLDISR
jgi:hypothetical protein